MIDLAIAKSFDTACVELCKLTPAYTQDTEGLLSLARAHEKRPVMLSNLSYQLHAYEKAFRKHGPDVARRKRNEIIAAVASMFMHAVKLQRDQQNLSAIAKQALIQKDSEKKEVASLIKETNDYAQTTQEN